MKGDERDERYSILICEIGGSAVAAYAPESAYIREGADTEVVMEGGGARGICLMVTRYCHYEDLVEYEKKTGKELRRIRGVWNYEEVEWNETVRNK